MLSDRFEDFLQHQSKYPEREDAAFRLKVGRASGALFAWVECCHFSRHLLRISPLSCALISLCASLVPARPSSSLGVVTWKRSYSLWHLTQRVALGEACSLVLGITHPHSMQVREEGGAIFDSCEGDDTGLRMGGDGGRTTGVCGVDKTMVAERVTVDSRRTSTSHLSSDLVSFTARPSPTANSFAKAEASGNAMNVRVAIMSSDEELTTVCSQTKNT